MPKLKLILVAIALCFMVPTASLAQNPLSTMAKNKSGSLWCFFLPQTCQTKTVDGSAKFRRGAKNFSGEYNANARFKRGARHFEATPVETAP